MREQLLKIIKKVPAVYNILLVIKYRKDEEFMAQIIDLRKNPGLIELQDAQTHFEPGSMVCHVNVQEKNAGFFALVRRVLDALYFCDCFSLEPFITFSNDSLYYDVSMPQDRNVFDYYFEQPCFSDSNIFKTKRTVVKYAWRNRLKAEALNKGDAYQVSEEYIVQMARIMKKYLHFNKETQKLIDEQLKLREVNQEVLGVHIRGTDYKLNCRNHPRYIPPEAYYGYIDSALKEYGFKKIYIATDDEEILQQFLKRYGGEKVIFSQNNTRSSGTCGVHTAAGPKREHHKYLLGIEVICDMCTLAACGGILSGLSQVSLMCRIYKKSKDEEFLYDKRLDMGINHKGKFFRVRSSAGS